MAGGSCSTCGPSTTHNTAQTQQHSNGGDPTTTARIDSDGDGRLTDVGVLQHAVHVVHLHLQPRRQCDAEAEHTEHLEAVREREPSQARVHVVLGGNERGTGQPHHEGAQDTDADAEPLQRDLERQVRSVFGVHEFVRQRVDGGHALEGTQREDTLDALAKVLATHTHTHTHTHGRQRR